MPPYQPSADWQYEILWPTAPTCHPEARSQTIVRLPLTHHTRRLGDPLGGAREPKRHRRSPRPAYRPDLHLVGSRNGSMPIHRRLCGS